MFRTAPSSTFFFVMILMIPEDPSASYFAEGDVITSTDLMSSAGIALSASAMLEAAIVEGRLLMSTRILLLPRRLTLPYRSTESKGTRFGPSGAAAARVVWSVAA